MQIKAVVFDLGQVVFKPARLERLAAASGLELAILKDFYWRFRDVYDLGVIDGNGFWSRIGEGAGQRFSGAKIRRLTNMDAFESSRTDMVMVQWMHDLKRNGIKVGILSNQPPETRDRVLSMDCLPEFDFCAFSSDPAIAIKKPAARIYRRTVEMSMLRPSELLFLDDRQENIAVAIKEGWQALLFTAADRLNDDIIRLGLPLPTVRIKTPRLVESSEQCCAYRERTFHTVMVSGIKGDPIFAREVAGCPVDKRRGVTIISRLPEYAVAHIRKLQLQAKLLEPSLVLYPEEALHLTVQACGFNFTAKQANVVVRAAKLALFEICSSAAPIRIQPLTLVVDQDGVALHFTPADDSLGTFRRSFWDALEDRSVLPEDKPSIHVNLARPATTVENASRLIELAQTYRAPKWCVQLDDISLCKGHVCYGIPQRVHEVELYRLGAELHSGSKRTA